MDVYHPSAADLALHGNRKRKWEESPELLFQPRNGNRYGEVTISNEARVQLGDTYNLQTKVQPRAGRYDVLLESLAFPRMEARFHNVAAALPTTCEWLFGHEQFQAWTEVNSNGIGSREHKILWIKGKPGSGKSTVMKATIKWAERTWPSENVLSYFFNARSPEVLERSSLGLYRSLLYQLLSATPSCRFLFEHRFKSKVIEDRNRDPEAKHDKVDDWTEIELQNFFLDLISATEFPPTNIFIDALDEGSEDDVRNMLRYLNRLTRDAHAANRKLRICIASRHYPNIAVPYSTSIIVEDQPGHKQDIERYISEELGGIGSPHMEHVRSQVRDRSAGVFLWVVLVVSMLNRAYDSGQSPKALLKTLESIPPRLGAIFAELVHHDPHDSGQCTSLLKWVLFAVSPLSPENLYRAVHLENAGEEEDIVPAKDLVDKWLLHCSRGLVESTSSSDTVQFIHETVRDYLARPVLDERTVTGQKQIDRFESRTCHTNLAEQCLSYMLKICEEGYTQKVESEVEGKGKKFPLAGYAQTAWAQHMKKSGQPCNPKILESALTLLKSRPHLSHTLTANVIGPDDLSDCYPLNLNSTGLACSLVYAVTTGIPELVRDLIRDGAVDRQEGIEGLALEVAACRMETTILEMLLDAGTYTDAQKVYRGAFFQAVKQGDHNEGLKVMRLLLERGVDVSSDEAVGSKLLIEAAKVGSTQTTQLLLESGVAVDAKHAPDNHTNDATALQKASRSGHANITKMLIDAGADVNFGLDGSNTALELAASFGEEEITRLLISAGADVNACSKHFESTPLRRAARAGYDVVVRMLLEAGANINVRDRFDFPVLHAALDSYHDSEKVVQSLLEAGSDVHALDGQGRTAMQIAMAKSPRNERVIQMLHDAGADADAVVGVATDTE